MLLLRVQRQIILHPPCMQLIRTLGCDSEKRPAGSQSLFTLDSTGQQVAVSAACRAETDSVGPALPASCRPSSTNPSVYTPEAACTRDSTPSSGAQAHVAHVSCDGSSCAHQQSFCAAGGLRTDGWHGGGNLQRVCVAKAVGAPRQPAAGVDRALRVVRSHEPGAIYPK